MVIQCPICKANLDIGASDPRRAMELHYNRMHPNKVIRVKQEPGQTLHELINNVKIQLNTREENAAESGNVQPGRSDEGAGTEDKNGQTVPIERKLSGVPESESKPFSRKRKNP